MATDSNSDMEAEDDLLLLDGDNFVNKSSDEDMLDEPVPSMYVFFMKTVRKVFDC